MTSSIRIAAAVAFLAGCTYPIAPPRVVPALGAEAIAARQTAVQQLMESVPAAAFEAATFTAADGTLLPYRLLRPSHIERGRTYPLIVLFHGSGAIGTDNVSQIGPLAKSWATPAMRERHPAFVLVPQFAGRSAVYRDAGTPAATSTGTKLLDAALALVDETVRTLPIDERRICAIGFSMGGSAVWNALALRPDRFAAAVAVSGVPNAAALRRGRTRLLLVHGDADEENPFAATLGVYDSRWTRRVELWQYRGLGHEFPPDLIVGTELADWLLRE